MSTTSSATLTGSDPMYEFDLSDRSTVNYRRHLGWRVGSVVGSIVAVAIMSYVEVLLLTVGPSTASGPIGAYTDSASWMLVTISFVILGSYAFRFWARPPVRMRVSLRGLEFESVAQSVRAVRWDDRSLELQVLDRSDDTQVPECSKYRLWVRGSPGDRWLPWRRVVPLVYLAEPGVRAVIDCAKRVGCRVYEQPSFTPISMISMGTCRAYQVQSPVE